MTGGCRTRHLTTSQPEGEERAPDSVSPVPAQAAPRQRKRAIGLLHGNRLVVLQVLTEHDVKERRFLSEHGHQGRNRASPRGPTPPGSVGRRLLPLRVEGDGAHRGSSRPTRPGSQGGGRARHRVCTPTRGQAQCGDREGTGM